MAELASQKQVSAVDMDFILHSSDIRVTIAHTLAASRSLGMIVLAAIRIMATSNLGTVLTKVFAGHSLPS